MDIVFVILFLIAFGSIFGWGLELVFRRIVCEAKKWINPGFLVGPCLPIYGFGLSFLFMIANLENYILIDNVILRSAVIVILMGIAMTLIEYIAGVIFIKRMKIKLWDYSNEWGNFQGIICPLYSFFWLLLSIIYYCFVHPYVSRIVNTAFESVVTYFVLGLFYGVFIIDLVYSMKVVTHIKHFAEEHQIVVRIEELKANIIKNSEERKKKAKFFLILSSDNTVLTNLKNYHESMKKIRADVVNKIKDDIKRRHNNEE